MAYFGSLRYENLVKPVAQGSWLDGSSCPGPTKEDLRILKDDSIAPAKEPLRLEVPAAAKLMLESLEQSSYKRGHVDALDTTTQHLYSRHDLPFQVFDDLDKELFRGMLKGNVYLAVSSLDRDYPGMTTRPGSKHRGLRGPRTTIQLSKYLVEHAERTHILAALLHQMIHAYFLQCCGHRNEGALGTGCDLTHHHGFSSVLYEIQDRFLKGKFPSLWGQKRKSHSNPWFTPGRGEPGSSDCYVNKQRLSKADCEVWVKRGLTRVKTPQTQTAGPRATSHASSPKPISQYLHLIEPEGSAPVPRLRTDYLQPGSSYVELIFDNRAFPLSKERIRGIPTLQRLLNTSGTGRITIPSTSYDEFRGLYSFLQRGDYAPSLDLLNSMGSVPSGATGPPCILQPQTGTPPFLLTDIRVYRLAREMSFQELRIHALSRLNRQWCTHNDPIEALEEIYHKLGPKHRDTDLRDWVKAWLMVKIPKRDVEYAKLYPTNLAVLQKSYDWKDRYQRLRERGGELITDVDAVEREMAEKAAAAAYAIPTAPGPQQLPEFYPILPDARISAAEFLAGMAGYFPFAPVHGQAPGVPWERRGFETWAGRQPKRMPWSSEPQWERKLTAWRDKGTAWDFEE